MNTGPCRIVQANADPCCSVYRRIVGWWMAVTLVGLWGFGCRWIPPGQLYSGNEFVIAPYAFRGQTVTLKIWVSPHWGYGTPLRIADGDPAMPIRFDNADDYTWRPWSMYWVTFRCRNGSLYTGNIIRRVRWIRTALPTRTARSSGLLFRPDFAIMPTGGQVHVRTTSSGGG